MVTAALDRLDGTLARAGQPSLKQQLAPGMPATSVREELEAMGLSPLDDLIAWFAYHGGGWLQPSQLQLLSFDGAIEHRMNLSQDLLVPFRSSWFPIISDSTESYLVDTKTGAVVHFDLERGEDEARQLATSLSAWIESIAVGASTSKKIDSTDWSVPAAMICEMRRSGHSAVFPILPDAPPIGSMTKNRRLVPSSQTIMMMAMQSCSRNVLSSQLNKSPATEWPLKRRLQAGRQVEARSQNSVI